MLDHVKQSSRGKDSGAKCCAFERSLHDMFEASRPSIAATDFARFDQNNRPTASLQACAHDPITATYIEDWAGGWKAFHKRSYADVSMLKPKRAIFDFEATLMAGRWV